jgi:trk system potassium uptake protein TrkH
MNYKMMSRLIGQILFVEGIFMIPALLISIAHGEGTAVRGFLIGLPLTLAIAAFLYVFGRKAHKGFFAREGLACVGLSWILLSFMGCLPFYFSGEIPHFIDALFEMVSGYTTTGASILTNVEAMSKGLLYWRSFSHWLGGMGVLVFLLAFAFGGGEGRKGFTMHLLRAESPGPNVSKLVPKMKQTARILYLLYGLLTVVNIVFLLFGGMSLFEAVCTAFGTAGTGGFGVKNDSIAGYSPYIQNVCTIFMFLFGVNFTCYYLLAIGRLKAVFKDEELRFYLFVAFFSIVLIVCNLRGYYGSLGETIRHAAFQVSSIMTTTGYATTDFDLWPGFSKALLLALMIIGACAGSTGGGFKCGRVLLVLKSLVRNVRQTVHPQRIQTVQINEHPVDEKVLENVGGFLAAYVCILAVSFLLVALNGFSLTTSLSSVIACFNNIGPGLELTGPTGNYSMFNDFSKLVLIFDMLAGRLEIFPILILFSRSAWKHR